MEDWNQGYYPDQNETTDPPQPPISGFDSVTPGDVPPQESAPVVEPIETAADTPQPEPTMYTPSAGQQAASPQEPVPAENSYAPAPDHGFFPSGSYSYGNAPMPEYPQRPVKPPRQKKVRTPSGDRGRVRMLVLYILIAAIVGGAAGGGTFALAFHLNGGAGEQGSPSTTSTPNSEEMVKTIHIEDTVESVVEAVAEKAGPSVVGIRTTAAVTGFFGGSTETTGEGSGVIFSADGYIITNYHVISEVAQQASSTAARIEVYLPNEPSEGIAASIVGYNISSDLAVIKIEKTGLTPVETGDSNQLKVGQYAVAIGNPGGLEFMGSVSYGIISGLNRSFSIEGAGDTKLIQTDAAINPGNSGGALLNTKGQLIGINSSKLVSTSYEGMGFAIPVNAVKEICNDIISHENEPAPYVGIEISAKYDSTTLQMLGYPAGAVVTSVSSGSPADESGIARGDIITEFAGVTISNYTSFKEALQSCAPNQVITVKFYRSGRFYTTSLTVGANNAQ